MANSFYASNMCQSVRSWYIQSILSIKPTRFKAFTRAYIYVCVRVKIFIEIYVSIISGRLLGSRPYAAFTDKRCDYTIVSLASAIYGSIKNNNAFALPVQSNETSWHKADRTHFPIPFSLKHVGARTCEHVGLAVILFNAIHANKSLNLFGMTTWVEFMENWWVMVIELHICMFKQFVKNGLMWKVYGINLSRI